MKRITTRFAVTVLTFIVGITAAAIRVFDGVHKTGGRLLAEMDLA